MVVVEPNAINVERCQDATKFRHPIATVVSVERADALPTIRRRRRLTIGPDRRGVGMFFQKLRGMHRIEFGKDLYTQLVIPPDLLGIQAA